ARRKASRDGRAVATGESVGASSLSGWDIALRLLLVLALLLILAALGRRMAASRLYGMGTRRTRGEPVLRVLEALPLGPQRALYLIQVGDRGIVVGVTAQTVQLLLELRPEELAPLLSETSAPRPGGFLHLLRKQLDEPARDPSES